MANIRNYMEEVVFDYLDCVLDNIDMCKCEICRMDIAAIALNQLPPKYIVTDQGQLYSKINNLKSQFEIDVVAAISRAALIVKKSPRHKIE